MNFLQRPVSLINFSATNLIFLVDLAEVDEKNAEFENSDDLNEVGIYKYLLKGLFSCYIHIFLGCNMSNIWVSGGVFDWILNSFTDCNSLFGSTLLYYTIHGCTM